MTQAAICQAIRAAQRTGAGAVRILVDGTISIDVRPRAEDRPEPGDLASTWDDVQAAPEAAIPRRRIGEKINDGDDPMSIALARYQRGEIKMAELPPGRYPNGMRVYADGEWEAEVRASPLQKRERDALKAYARAKGTIGYVKGGGLLTTERLAVRGFVEVVQTRPNGKVPFYGITPAGEAEWLRQAPKETEP